ncbi:hypothetical protein [Blautia glucerasea]|uniref:hypothetical protein n=1 Tax=Blautia glucerasea TaxID=536633 RepID=UPI00156E424D|nr:hypothetical protein [Blautia glucerasea]NSJ26672.1 hypothetical protein [Blautia glucerasea]
MKNEKRKKGKVRCLSVLLTGCLLLSVMPATAFATEDTTVAAEDKDTIAEKTQMSEQESTPGENRTEESVTDESKADESKAGECSTEESSAEEGNSGESKTEEDITDEMQHMKRPGSVNLRRPYPPAKTSRIQKKRKNQ